MPSLASLSCMFLAITAVLAEDQEGSDVQSKYLQIYSHFRSCLQNVSHNFETVTKALEKVDGKLSAEQSKEVKKAVEESADVLEGFREAYHSKKVSKSVIEKLKTAGEDLKSGETPDKVNSALSAANDKLQDAIKRRLYSMEGTKDNLVNNHDLNGFGDSTGALLDLGNKICDLMDDTEKIVKSPIIKNNS